MVELNATGNPANPLAGPRLWNEAAEAYSGTIACHLARYAADALRLAEVGSGLRIADVACGPGALSFAAARLGARATAIDFSPDMIARLRLTARHERIPGVEALVGDGQALPLASASCGASFSMFGLIFFPDRHRGFRELLRVLEPGGRAVVGAWVPVQRMPMMAAIYRTLGELLPSLTFGGRQTPLGEAGEFRAEMSAAGFRQVEVHEVIHALAVASIVDLWETLERSTPPIRAVREAVGPDRWLEVRRDIVEALVATWGTGPQQVPMIANLGVGLS